MLTLSSLKYDLKSILRVIGIVLGTVLVIFLLFKIGLFVKEIVRPSPPTPPDVKFGKLPKISFPESVTKEKLTYKIDTLSGNIPGYSHLAYVYKMKVPKPDLLALERANEKAASVGFKEGGKKVSENVYEWKSEEPPKALRMSTRTYDFTLRTNFSTSSAFFTNTEAETDSINQATGYLQAMDLLYDDIDTEKTATFLYSIENGALKESSSLSGSQAIGVYFFQKDVNDLPVYYPEGKSTMNLVATNWERGLYVASGSFSYQTPDLEDKSTYSIKSGAEAFEELKKGNGYIARFFPEPGEILIKNIYLGYYIGREKQQYLMPIFIFEGNNFLAYISSLKDELIRN